MRVERRGLIKKSGRQTGRRQLYFRVLRQSRLPEISRAAGPSRSFVGQRDNGDRRLELETFAVPESQSGVVAEKPSWAISLAQKLHQQDRVAPRTNPSSS
jgi:hypothetical protein